MIHIRAVSPSDVTAGLVESLLGNAGVLNLMVLSGVARNPDGDAIHFDVINAEANHVLEDLRARGVDRRGSIVIEDVGAALSERAALAEAQAPRALALAPIWRRRWPGSGRRSLSVQLVHPPHDRQPHRRGRDLHELTDPDRGGHGRRTRVRGDPRVALALGQRDRPPARAGSDALLVGFLAAIVVSVAFSAVVRGFGWEPDAFKAGVRPVSI
jgi:hypothetical protein